MTEAEFSRQLVKLWREQGALVQRVETGSITRGVPDIYVANSNGQMWIELKSVRWNPYDGMQVPWRAGQQGWMLEHYRSCGKYCLTIVHCPSCYLVIKMIKRFKNNQVNLADCAVYHHLKELLL